MQAEFSAPWETRQKCTSLGNGAWGAWHQNNWTVMWTLEHRARRETCRSWHPRNKVCSQTVTEQHANIYTLARLHNTCDSRDANETNEPRMQIFVYMEHLYITYYSSMLTSSTLAKCTSTHDGAQPALPRAHVWRHLLDWGHSLYIDWFCPKITNCKKQSIEYLRSVTPEAAGGHSWCGSRCWTASRLALEESTPPWKSNEVKLVVFIKSVCESDDTGITHLYNRPHLRY